MDRSGRGKSSGQLRKDADLGKKFLPKARVGKEWAIGMLLSLVLMQVGGLFGSDFFEEKEDGETNVLFRYLTFTSVLMVAMLLSYPYLIAVSGAAKGRAKQQNNK